MIVSFGLPNGATGSILGSWQGPETQSPVPPVQGASVGYQPADALLEWGSSSFRGSVQQALDVPTTPQPLDRVAFDAVDVGNVDEPIWVPRAYLARAQPAHE